MNSCATPNDNPVNVDAFTSFGWVGALAAPGLCSYVNPDPLFVVVGSCFEALAQRSCQIGHKIVDSLRRQRSGHCRCRRRCTEQAESSSPAIISDSNPDHSLPGDQEASVVDLPVPPPYEAALTMAKPHHGAQSFFRDCQTQQGQVQYRGHPPEYTRVEYTKEGVTEGKFYPLVAGTSTTELGPPPSYEQFIRNTMADYDIYHL